ncbi:hypothetical protein [Streptomyces xylophagus]|uniref:hypothetical protein n=1 Tax=Streptomyces xylophagus TaxID=285514 RepID=UPI00131C8A81|nr:hypothetical protein [Streptomyces xylophagus]
MYSEGIKGREHKLICSDCGEAFSFRIEMHKHQDPKLKQCPGVFWSRRYTATTGIARGK